MIRLFAAVAIPDAIAEGLVRRQTGLKGARWRPRDALHVTLRFFGEIREDVARDLDAELLRVSGSPFEISMAGAGAFGEGAELEAIWVGVGGSDPLNRLARACEGAARRVGLRPETRRYRPHVTLAYLRHADPAEAAGWIQANNLLQSPPMRVERFALYSSLPGSQGSHYRLEAEYPLDQARTA